VSQSNSHELEIISKVLKITKKSRSESSTTSVPVAPPSRPQQFNDRGLQHQRLSDAVSHYTFQTQLADHEMLSLESGE
jgi:hypothetical protein